MQHALKYCTTPQKVSELHVAALALDLAPLPRLDRCDTVMYQLEASIDLMV